MKEETRNLFKLIEHYFGDDLCHADAIINDINFSSDDVDDFMEEFRYKFNVDMESYNYYDYFHENFLPFGYLLSKLLIRSKVKKKKTPLVVKHLLLIIDKGQWVIPKV